MGQASLYKHRAPPPPQACRTGGTMRTAQARKEVYLLGVVDKDAQRENLVQIEVKSHDHCSKYLCV